MYEILENKNQRISVLEKTIHDLETKNKELIATRNKLENDFSENDNNTPSLVEQLTSEKKILEKSKYDFFSGDSIFRDF